MFPPILAHRRLSRIARPIALALGQRPVVVLGPVDSRTSSFRPRDPRGSAGRDARSPARPAARWRRPICRADPPLPDQVPATSLSGFPASSRLCLVQCPFRLQRHHLESVVHADIENRRIPRLIPSRPRPGRPAPPAVQVPVHLIRATGQPDLAVLVLAVRTRRSRVLGNRPSTLLLTMMCSDPPGMPGRSGRCRAPTGPRWTPACVRPTNRVDHGLANQRVGLNAIRRACRPVPHPAGDPLTNAGSPALRVHLQPLV